VSRLVSAAKGLGEELHAVADAERRQVFLDHPVRELRRALLVDARRTAGEDDRPGVELLDLFPRAVMRDELAENANLPDAAGDELAVLRSEVEDDGGVDLMVRIGGVFEELDGLVNDIDVDHVAFSRVDRGRGGCVGCAHEYSFTCLERACWRDGMARRSRNGTMVPDDGIPAGELMMPRQRRGPRNHRYIPNEVVFRKMDVESPRYPQRFALDPSLRSG